jgi:hypothetical protein
MPLLLTDLSGNPTSPDLNGAFPAGSVGQAVDYLVRELRNAGGGTLTGGRLFATPDPSGGGFALAVLDATARDLGYGYVPNPAAGSYSTPTDSATGLVLPDLAAGKKCLIGIRRDLTTATVPPGGAETNTVRVTFTAPITYA